MGSRNRGPAADSPAPAAALDLREQYAQFETIHREMEEVYSSIYRRFVHPAGPPFYEEAVEQELPADLISEHRSVARALSDYLRSLRDEAEVLTRAKALCEAHGYVDNEATRAATREVLDAILRATKHRTTFGRILDRDWLETWERATEAVRRLRPVPGSPAGADAGWLNEVVDDLLERHGAALPTDELWEATAHWVSRPFACGEVTRKGEVLCCVGARSAYPAVKFQTFRQRVATRRRARGKGGAREAGEAH